MLHRGAIGGKVGFHHGKWERFMGGSVKDRGKFAKLGRGFKYFSFFALLGEMIQFDKDF